ncbi:MAG: efflux RND transporter periplasmic adaptor subunit [Bacillota bacterium]
MKNKIIVVIMSILLITVFAVPKLEAAVSVNVKKAIISDISEESVVNGRIVPDKTISIVSEINGKIEELNVEMGQYVEKGEELIIFEDDQIQAQFNQAAASLKAAKANLEGLKKGASENDIDASLANIKQAEASLEMAESQHSLLLEGASEEDIKSAEESYNQAVASYEGAKKSLESIKKVFNDKTSLKQQLNNAEMQMETSKKQLESAEKRYDQSELSLEQAVNNFEQAEKEYERTKNLYEDDVVTEKQFETAESQYKNAQIAVQNAKSSKESAEIALKQAEISYEGAKESYRLTKESFDDPTELKQQLDSAETQVKVSEANMKIAKANLEKAKKGAREEEVNSSLAQVKQAEAALESARANHEKLKAGARDEEIRASEAQVEQAEASLEQARLRLEDAVIKSPISGFVTNISTSEGQLIGQGSSLFNIVKLDPAYVRVGVSSDVLVNIKKGEKVDVELLDYENEEREGTIENISPVRDQQSQLYTVMVKLNNDDNKLKSGMFADVHFTLNTKEEVVIIPADSVLDLDGEPYVYVVENGKAVKKDIKIGLINKNSVEVVEGISEGEEIIIQGHKSLQEGEDVEVIKR